VAVNAPPPSELKKLPGTQTLQGPPRSAPKQRVATPVPGHSSGRIRAAMAKVDGPLGTLSPPSPEEKQEARVTPVALAQDLVVAEDASPSRAPSVSPASPRASQRPRAARSEGVRRATWDVLELMRGASQPPFRSDSPGAHAHIPKAPKVPVGLEAELAETLALPPGLTGMAAPLEVLPSSVIDARVQFTLLSRELAREYREDLGVILRVELEGIEAIQAQLLERYPEGTLRSMEEAIDVRKHGAFLSEVLARKLDAFWVDIAPSDLGYWAMVVPPATRVWPFGRILRLIAMQHKERDLVSYYLEVQARAK
jgi:hypothetical protein